MVSWDGKKPSKPKKQDPQKCTKKGPLFWTPIEASRGKKGKIRYVLNGFSANPTYPEFCGQKNSDFSGRMEVALSLFERVAPTPRNPYKTSAKPLLGESGRTPGTRFPFLEGKMWPDSPPTACIYIYICCQVLLGVGESSSPKGFSALVKWNDFRVFWPCQVILVAKSVEWAGKTPKWQKTWWKYFVEVEKRENTQN